MSICKWRLVTPLGVRVADLDKPDRLRPEEALPSPSGDAPQSSEVSASADRYLNALAADYVALREDHQSLDQVTAALISVAVVLMGTLGALLFGSCDLRGGRVTCSPRIPPAVYAFLPLGPLAILSLFGAIANVNTLRSYYMRAVEREMQTVAGSPPVEFRGGGRIRLPSFGQLVDGVVSQRGGLARYRFLNFLIYLTMGVLFIGSTALCLLLTRPIDLRIAMSAFYAASIVVLLRVLWAGSIGGRMFWQDVTKRWSPSGYPDEQSEDEQARESTGRPLISYLVLPRPGDLLVKGWIVPVAWLISAEATGQVPWRHLWTVVGLTLAFELLLYQARYIVNDLRGLAVDSRHSTFKRRIRFPPLAGPQEIRAAILVVVIRLGLVIWVASRVLDSPFRDALLIATIVVIAQTAIYEALRERVSPDTGPGLLAMTLGRGSVLIMVGVGYAIRTCLGLLLGQLDSPDWSLVGVTALGMTALGSMFVAMTWAIDGVTQVVPRDGEDLPTDRYRETLQEMCHIAPLLRQARLLEADDNDRLEATQLPSPADDKQDPLYHRRVLEPISGWTWWNVMLVTAAAFMSFSGVLLAGDHRRTSLALATAVGLIAGIAIIVLYGGNQQREEENGLVRAASWGLLSVIGGSIALTGIVWTSYPKGSLVASIPFAVVALAYVWFRHASPAEIQFDPNALKTQSIGFVMAIGRGFVRIVFGTEAERRLKGKRDTVRQQAGERYEESS
jgi:hypothetical protein